MYYHSKSDLRYLEIFFLLFLIFTEQEMQCHGNLLEHFKYSGTKIRGSIVCQLIKCNNIQRNIAIKKRS